MFSTAFLMFHQIAAANTSTHLSFLIQLVAFIKRTLKEDSYCSNVLMLLWELYYFTAPER